MKKQPKDRIATMIDKAETPEKIKTNWRDHVDSRHSIKSYSVIMKEEMFTIFSDSEGSLFPHVEFNTEKETHWVVKISPNGREVFRANIKSIDLIEWNLFPSSTN